MIELTRDITFGQYINNGSSLSRMDPRTKVFCAVLLIALTSYISKFSAFALCLLFCIVVQWLSHISTLYVLRSYRPFLLFLAFVLVFQVLFYQEPPHTPLLWHWWILSVSWPGIISSLSIMTRVLFLYYFTSMLFFATSLIDLTDGTESLLSPLQRIGVPVTPFVTVLMIAFKFVPIFIVEIERLMKAQAARGVRFDKGNFVQRTLKMAPILIPLFVSGFKRAETLSIAMEARCFGGRPGWRRSKRRAYHFERFDAIVLAATLLFCIAAVAINITALF